MGEQEQRHYVKYSFYKLAPLWRTLSPPQRRGIAQEVLAAVGAFSDEMLMRSYNLQGMRGDVDFMIWQITPRLESLQEFAMRLANTELGAYLATPYSYLGMTRGSPYVEGHRHGGQEGTRLALRPRGSRYVFVYPFVKTRGWYRLTKAERQGMMNEHFDIGHKYPSVKISTSYSFGLDDQEFVLAFETDHPAHFLDLVMELRETEASLYTLRDTPIFACIAADLGEIVEGPAG